jgi:glycosyltransferase involved in cell wall biosynthesis
VHKVDVISLYNTVNAGVRARALTWLERLGLDHQLHSYFDGGAAGLGVFARSPGRAACSERQLRALAEKRPDTLFLRREATPLGRGRLEDRLLRSSRHGVYDIDDALYHDVRGWAFERLFSKGATAAQAAAAADVVIVGNSYLAEWASALNNEVRIVPTCVEPEAYRVKRSYDIADGPRLVWLGTPSGERYVADIAPALQRLNREHDARVTIVGSVQEQLGDLEAVIDRVPWSLLHVHDAIGTYDIGLMPLRDTPYERGKCAYKLLEYGAAGLPSVASPVGANASILREAGAPAPRTTDEWYQALDGLLRAPAAERARLGGQLREVVADGYSFARHESAWRWAVVP